MKKFIYSLFLLGLCFPLLQVTKANEYQFFKTTTNNDAVVGGSESTPTIKFFGVSTSGTETLLNTWQSSTTNVRTFNGNLGDARVDQYKGKIYFEVNEFKTGSNSGITTILEYDLLNNAIQTVDNISEIEDIVIYPKDLENMIREESDGTIHIGENSLITNKKEINGKQPLYAEDASGKRIPINIEGSRLLINGRDVEQSINNIGALSAALTGLPTMPTDTTLACGLGTGTHGGDFAFSGGCASKVNEKLSLNYAASMTMPGQDYAGDFEDTFSARAGFVWKLGKSVKPTLISMKEKEKMEEKIYSLEENNKKIISQNEDLKQKNQSIISQNKSLLARLERLEKMALSLTKSKDLATIKLP